MKTLLTVLILFAASASLAQTVNDFSRTSLLSHPSVTLYGHYGWNKSQAEPTAGNFHITPLAATVWSGELQYTVPLSQSSALPILLGGGVIGFDQYIEGYEELNRQWAFNFYIPYAKVGLGYEHRWLIKDVHLLTPMVSVGGMVTSNIDMSYGSHFGWSEVLDDTQYRWLVDSEADQRQIHPFIDFRMRWGKFLKRHDVLSLHMGYRLGLGAGRQTFYKTGSIYPHLGGEGSYHHKGSEFYMGTSYTFNNYKKRKKKTALVFNDHQQSNKELNANRKATLEEARSNSYRLTIEYGSNHIREHFSNELYYSSKLSGPGQHLLFGLVKERPKYYWGGQIANNLFFTRYRISDKVYPNNPVSYTDVSNLNTWQFGAVLGSYWRNKKRTRRFLTYEAGLHLATTLPYTSDVFTNYTSDSTGTADVTYGNVAWFPLVHLGVGTTVRLYDQIYWNVGATYYQGIRQAYYERFDFKDWNGIMGLTEKTSNGSYFTFKTGLSFHFNPKEKQ